MRPEPKMMAQLHHGTRRLGALIGMLLVAAASVVVLASSGGFLAWSLGGILVGLAFLAWDT